MKLGLHKGWVPHAQTQSFFLLRIFPCLPYVCVLLSVIAFNTVLHCRFLEGGDCLLLSLYLL